jgi:hypothetical protein
LAIFHPEDRVHVLGLLIGLGGGNADADDQRLFEAFLVGPRTHET